MRANYNGLILLVLLLIIILLFLLMFGRLHENPDCTEISTTTTTTTTSTPTSAPTGGDPFFSCRLNPVLRQVIDLKENVNATADGRITSLEYNPNENMLFLGTGIENAAWVSINPSTYEISQNYLPDGVQVYGGGSCGLDEILALGYWPSWETTPPAGGGVWVAMTTAGIFSSMDLYSTTCVDLGTPFTEIPIRGFTVSDDKLYGVESGRITQLLPDPFLAFSNARLLQLNITNGAVIESYNMTIPGYGQFEAGVGAHGLAKSRTSPHTYVLHYDVESVYDTTTDGGHLHRQIGRIDLSTGIITRAPVLLDLPWGISAITFDNNNRLWFATYDKAFTGGVNAIINRNIQYLYSIEESDLNACFSS